MSSTAESLFTFVVLQTRELSIAVILGLSFMHPLNAVTKGKDSLSRELLRTKLAGSSLENTDMIESVDEDKISFKKCCF